MPLTDLIRYFNLADTANDSTLYQDNGRAAAWHCGLRLGSLFRPIIDLRSERIVGHQALLAVNRADGTPGTPEDAYATCETPEAIVHFDRLCRTLHALNFLAQQRTTGGYLQLAVHARHVQAVPNQHGLVYEAILKRCGLAPQDIVLQLDDQAFSTSPGLEEALENYRLRGYRLALSVSQDGAAKWPTAFIPDLVQVAPDHDLTKLEGYRQLGVAREVGGIDNPLIYQQARTAGIELGQGNLFGSPQADCQATHDQDRVAYNFPSSFGAPHENRQ